MCLGSTSSDVYFKEDGALYFKVYKLSQFGQTSLMKLSQEKNGNMQIKAHKVLKEILFIVFKFENKLSDIICNLKKKMNEIRFFKNAI